jgi:hypothetical protein
MKEKESTIKGFIGETSEKEKRNKERLSLPGQMYKDMLNLYEKIADRLKRAHNKTFTVRDPDRSNYEILISAEHEQREHYGQSRYPMYFWIFFKEGEEFKLLFQITQDGKIMRPAFQEIDDLEDLRNAKKINDRIISAASKRFR